MSKPKKVLANPNDGKGYNPSDFTSYDQYNAPKNDFTSGSSVSGFNYERDDSLDRNNISPYDLPTLNDTRAENQGIFSSLGNSALKFVGKTGANLIGGIVGTAYGVGSAIANGEVSKIWDNSFMDKMDTIDNKLDNVFKVYKSSEYEESNFLQKAFLHPLQFTDEATEALSFTAGAILTELLTQGIGSSALVPKAMKYLKFLGEGAEAAEATAQIANVGRAQKIAGQFGTTVRQLATGASYESMVEARQATMSLRTKMLDDYSKDHPNEPIPESVTNDIDDRLSKAGLFSYLTNLALVGTTNILEFPKIFGAGFNTARVAEGSILRNAETGLYEAASKGTSLAGKIVGGLKNPFYEGFVEEGLQSVIQNTNQHYFDRKNNPDAKFDVSNYLKDFAENIADTYTSKEGWNSIGMGMLIGGLGAPGKGIIPGKRGTREVIKPDGSVSTERAEMWTGGILGASQEEAEDRKHIQSVVDDLNNNTNLKTSMQANYDHLVRNKTLENDKEKALKNNDIFEFNNAKDDQIHSYVSSRIKAGLFSEVEDTVEDMRNLSPEEFYTQYRGDEADNKTTKKKKIQFQQETIDEFEKKANNTNEAWRIIEQGYSGNNEDIKEELVHSIAASKNLDVREKDMNKRIGDLSNGLLSNLELRKDNTISLKERVTVLEQLVQTEGLDKDEVKALNKEIKDIKKQRNQSLTLNEHNALVNLRETDPTAYATNRKEISTLLQDSRRLRARRQEYLSLYNDLFTEEGQKAFEQTQLNQQKEIEKQQEEIAKQEEVKAQEVEKKKNIKETKTKVDNAAKVERNQQEAPDLQEAIITPDNPNEVNTHAFDEFLDEQPEVQTPIEVTPEEKTVVDIENHKEESSNKDDLMTSNQLTKDPDTNTLEDIDSSLQVINLGYERTVGNSVGYLGLDYDKYEVIVDGKKVTKYVDRIDEDGNVVINNNVDPRLFSQNYYNVGSKVSLNVPSFADMQERGLQNYTEVDYKNDIKVVDSFPIAIRGINNKIIGYLPTQNNIRNNVAEDFREQALKENLALRQTIFEIPDVTYSTTISSKSPGWLIKDKTSNQKNLFDALGDGTKLANKVELSIGKALTSDGVVNLFNNTSTQFNSGEVINQAKLKNGYIYAVVPTSSTDKYVAYPMKINKIGDNNAQTIIEAINIFAKLNIGYELSESEQNSVNNINEYNFKNFKDLSGFINNIMYNSTEGNDNTIFKLFKDNLILSKTTTPYKLTDIISSDEVKNEIYNILKDRYHSIDLSNLNTKNKYFNYSFNNGVIQEDSFTNYQEYLHKNGVITSNIKGINLGNNEFAFTAQSVIGLSNEVSRDNGNKINNTPSWVNNNIDDLVNSALNLNISIEKVRELNDKDLTAKEIASNLIKDNPKLKEYSEIGSSKGLTSITGLVRAIRSKYNMSSLDDKREFVSLQDIASIMQEANQELATLAQEQEKQITKSKVTNKKIFDPKNMKPKNLGDLDINPEYIVQQNIKSGEDLMRRCL